MANWNLPVITDLYTSIISLFKDRDLDLAKDLDPAFVTVTNPVINMRSWNSANHRWEKYNGSAWVEAETSYSINVTTLGGLSASLYATKANPTFTGLVTVPAGITIQAESSGEGGQLVMLKASSDTIIAGAGLINDLGVGNIRWFEGGGSFRGVYVNIAECGPAVSSPIWHGGNFNPASKQNALGFTPVKQGGTINSGSNTISIGWNNSGPSAENLEVKVDATEFTNVWPINISGSAVTAINATNAVSKTSTSIQQMNGVLTGQLSSGNIQASSASIGFETRSAGASHDAFHNFYIPGVFNLNFGLDRTTQQLTIGGGSLGAVKYKVWTEQNFNPATKADVGSLTITTENINVDNSGSPLASTVGYYLVSASISQPTPLTIRLTRVWDVTPVSDGGD